jgi:NAD(P)-dependent dehydrogenase (short-subunit alcohol dehydrogenase family)
MEHFNFNNELSGHTALVTGGTKGTGKAIAERLQQAGATVIITARNSPDESHKNLHFIPADLSTPEGTAKVMQEVKSTFGKLDILVNNLGGSDTPGGGFSVLTDDDWITTLQSNLLAPVRLDRGFLPGMLHSGQAAVVRFHPAVCSRQSWAHQLQQKFIQRGFTQRGACADGFTRLD